MLRSVLTESDQCSGYSQSDLLFVLFEYLQLVPELLSSLEADSEEQEDVIDPGDHGFRLVPVELGHVGLGIGHNMVDGEDQLEALQVKAQGQLRGNGRY